MDRVNYTGNSQQSIRSVFLQIYITCALSNVLKLYFDLGGGHYLRVDTLA